MSKSKKNAAVLFEAMSKVPVSQSAVRRGGLAWFRRDSDDNAAPLIVAEALTEEEAADEIAADQAVQIAEQAELERAEQEKLTQKEAARAEKLARRAEKRALRAERRAARRTAAAAAAIENPTQAGVADAPLARFERGRLVLNLGTVSCIIAASVVSAVAIGSFALGRRGNDQALPLEDIAGVTNRSPRSGSPLLGDGSRPTKADSGRSEGRQPGPRTTKKPLSTADGGTVVRSNKPVSVARPTAAGPLDPTRNYLQIESFRVSRYNTAEQVRAELRDVQAFLLERGLRTVARQNQDGGRLRGFVLFSEQGMPTGKRFQAERQQLQSRVRELGRTYRNAGGRYEFRGCFFVSAAKAQGGEPVAP